MKRVKLIFYCALSQLLLVITILTPIYYSNNYRSELKSSDVGVVESEQTEVKGEKVIEEVKKPIEKIIKEEKQWINIRVSYYTISKRDTGKLDGITASGKNLKSVSRGENIIYIATPKGIVFNTKLYIEGVGNCTVVDRGSSIKWHGNVMWVDVFVANATQKELLELGVKYTKGYIVKE